MRYFFIAIFLLTAFSMGALIHADVVTDSASEKQARLYQEIAAALRDRAVYSNMVAYCDNRIASNQAQLAEFAKVEKITVTVKAEKPVEVDGGVYPK